MKNYTSESNYSVIDKHSNKNSFGLDSVIKNKDRRRFLKWAFKSFAAALSIHYYKLLYLIPSLNLTFLTSCSLKASSPAPTLSILITVNWLEALYEISPQAFGINGFKATNPDETTNSHYINRMKYLLGTRSGGGMLRIHTWEMMGSGDNGWLNSDNTWNALKVQRSIKGLTDAGFTVCINIPNGSQSNNKVEYPRAFAQFCADLVQIVNIDGGLGIVYWEIPNEQDENRNGEQLAEIFNIAATAMKSIDPSIKVGGPAYQYPNRTSEVHSFINRTLENLDFITFHNYAGGGGMTDEEVWNAAGAEYYNTSFRKYLDKVSPSRHIELWYDEFNVGWSWDLAQEQQNGMCGAVYDALTLSKSLDFGADILCAWNEKDGSYGKMDDDFNLRPAGHVFHMFNTFVYGHRVATTTTTSSSSTTTTEEKVIPYASKSLDGRHTLLLTNRTKEQQTVRVNTPRGSKISYFSTFQLTALGYEQKDTVSQNILRNGIVLPAESVTVFTYT